LCNYPISYFTLINKKSEWATYNCMIKNYAC